MRQTGISDPFVSRNSVERTCNRFAAAFLVPEPYVTELLGSRNPPKTPSLDDVAWLSRRFKISQEASILRVERLGLTELGTYERWKRLTHNNNPDFSTKGGGGGKAPPDQEKVKLAKYGFHFAAVFGPTLDFGGITELNLYRSSGLKPKYQRAYFDYANSLSSNELNDLELEDE
jgi:hypothetical protein